MQIVVVKVFLNRSYTVYSLYLPPHVPVERDNLEGIARDLPYPFLLYGDFNAHHPLWCLS